MELRNKHCATCAGEGHLGTENGLSACPDCSGTGQLPSAPILHERRLRELERSYSSGGQAGRDVLFLVDLARRSQDALTQIMGVAMEADPNDELAKRIRFLANRSLGLYPVVDEE